MIAIILATLLQSAPASVPVAAKVNKGDQKVCRKYVETGSLVRTTKVCRTRADWLRTEQDARAEGQQMQNNPNPNGG